MSLTAKDIEEITRLLEDSSFDELELEIGGMKLHLRRKGSGAGEGVSGLDVASAEAHSSSQRQIARAHSNPENPSPAPLSYNPRGCSEPLPMRVTTGGVTARSTTVVGSMPQ